MSRLRDYLTFRRGAPASANDAVSLPADAALVRKVTVLSTLSDADIAQLFVGSNMLRFPPDSRLVRQGDPSFDAIVLLEGEVRVVTENAHGDVLLAKVPAPALLGEIGALADLPRTATIVAGVGVRALRVPCGLLREVLGRSPSILMSVIGRLGQHIQSVNGAIGFYAGSIAALEQEEFDLERLLRDLQNPIDSLRDFSAAFENLAKHIATERRKRKDMASAALIQTAMLPQALGDLETGGRARLEGGMLPAREVGGDFYDAFMIDDRHLALMIGDVSGKGVPASLFMSMTVTAVRLVARQELDVAAVARRVNTLLFEQNAASMFSTLFYGILDLETGHLAYVNCGHNPPVAIRAGGKCELLVGGGTPLGILPERKSIPRSLTLARGDSLFLYTDGVTESQTPSGEEYGEARLLSCLQEARCSGDGSLRPAVMRDVLAFSQGADQFDDITCLAVHL